MQAKDEYIVEVLKYYELVKINNIQQSFYEISCEDDDSFIYPSYNEIVAYVDSSKKYEDYFGKIKKSLDEFDAYVAKHSNFIRVYKFTNFNKYTKISNKLVNKFLEIFETKQKAQPLTVADINEKVEACVDNEIKEKSLELVNLLIQLNEKAYKYVKSNSIFGEAYRVKAKKKEYNNKVILDEINKLTIKVKQVINMKIVPDFFDDGTEDLKKMMIPLFEGIAVLTQVNKKIVKNEFDFDNSYKNIDSYLKAKLKDYYSPIDRIINKEFLSNFNEEKLKEKLAIIKDLKIEKEMSFQNSVIFGNGEKKLNNLIGLDNIKDSIAKIKAYCIANKGNKLNLHMAFYGNPGTGKTEVARLIAEILHENGILPTKKCVEVERKDLVGEYIGETPQKTEKVINSAMGGVLFIDEAYSLVPDKMFDYGHEAVATLIKAMEDNRGKFCVILAGYKNEMEKMIKTNPGFKSRIQFHLDFKNYSRDELSDILDLMHRNMKYDIKSDAKNKILDITDVLKKNPDFANAREIRNILDQVIMCLNLRDVKSKTIEIQDVNKYITDNKISVATNKETKKVLSGDEELDELIGLDNIKTTIKKIRAYAKKNKDSKLNLHMAFYGNPGTGKTEVARIISRILNENDVLPEAKLIETTANGLVSEYIGATGEKTQSVINKALGGVLFIDEAYSLTNNQHGKEAIDTLLKEMEDKRGQFTVILAGYRNEMKKLLSANPGFESRIQFELDFPNYTKEELALICKKMLNKQDYNANDDVINLIVDIVELDRNKPTFANARTLRNVLDKIILNQSLRTENLSNNDIIIDDVMEYIKEKNLVLNSLNDKKENKLIVDLEKEYKDFDIELVDNEYLDEAVISISSDNSEGTGFIISSSGLCLTCNHCIIDNGETQKARIIFNAGKKKIKTYSSFDVVRKDEKNDLALIQLKEDNEYSFIPLDNRDYKYIPLKEFIMAGYPFGGETFTSISITDGKVASVNDYDGRTVVFANMFGKPGNSGSPVIDKNNKKVIGVFWGGISQGTEMIPCFTPLENIWDLFK